MKKIDLRFWRNPRLRYGSVSTLLLCLALAALVALNALFTTLENRNSWRVDCSFNSLTTYSDQTAEVLAQVSQPVVIYALFEHGQEDLQLFALLDRYCAASDHITWEQTPLSLNPSMATRFAGGSSGGEVSTDCIVVYCPGTDRFRVLTPVSFIGLSVDALTGQYEISSITYEKELTAAISYVTQEKIPVVWMVQGHGEVNADAAASLTELLMDNHYDVRFATLANMTLNPGDLVVFLAPQSDLTATEQEKLMAFAEAGGSLLFAMTPYDPLNGSTTLPGGMPRYREVMRLYGVIPLDGMVWASSGSSGAYDGKYRYNLIATLEASDVTFSQMLGGLLQLPMSQARALQDPDDSLTSPILTRMLSSATATYLLPVNATSIAQPADAQTGPFLLGLQSVRITATGEASRAVALGATSILTSEEAHSNADNREFIVRIVDYLVDNESEDLSIAPKVAFRPMLSADALSLGSIMLVGLPLVVLAAALIILVPRRYL
ncbi:MAG: Gldg family protein [Clostridia bacterium]|nr:Gldg family protein [Clostridia bacterium]